MRTSASQNTSAARDRSAPVRSDARRNRERILRAARDAFATRGVDVPLTTIARQAGVGIATLYRHFPTRDDLVSEVFATELQRCGALLEAALSDADPGRGLRVFIERLCAMQRSTPGFTGAFLARPPDALVAAKRRGGTRDLAELVRHARDARRVRADLDENDVIVLLLAHNALCELDLPRGSSARFLAHMLQSFGLVDPAPLPRIAPVDLGRLIGPLPPA